MDPRFVAHPDASSIVDALAMWPELSGFRLRPLLVSAFGDIYVETEDGSIWLADPIEVSCSIIASSSAELESLFSDPAWAEERLITDLALLAGERGIERLPHQVFAFAPHPSLTGSLRLEQMIPMELHIWHGISRQLHLGG